MENACLQNATGLSGGTDCFFVGDKASVATVTRMPAFWTSVLVVGMLVNGL